MERFEAPIVAAERGGAFVTVPPEVVDALGGGGRTKVRATFDGADYQGSIVSMGGERVLGIRKDIQAAIAKTIGDIVAVTVERDDADRVVTIADDLREALAGADLLDAFVAQSYSHQREYVTWIDGAKKPETRARRIAGTIERLQA